MNLTPAQRATLKALAASNYPDAPLTVDGSAPIAAAWNAVASPDFTVWRSFVPLAEVVENGFVWTEVDQLVAGKARIWEWMTGTPNSRTGERGFNPSKENVRAGLADTFGPATQSRANLLAHGKRLATVLEKLFATGTGSVASPATMAVGADGGYIEGAITMQEVYLIRAEVTS